MSRSLVLLAPLLMLVLAAIVVAVVLAVTARPDHTLSRELAVARRHGVATSVVAAVLLLTGWALAPFVAGPVAGVGPLLGSAAALVALWVGERTWPRPSGATRTALVHDRTVRGLLRGRWAHATEAAGAFLAVVIVCGGLLADTDGRTVASVEISADGVTEVVHTAGAFPGWPYGLPQLAALAVVAALVLLVLRAATHRAAVVTADLATDGLLRRASAARAFRTALVGVLLTAGADLVFGGLAARRVYDGVPHALAVAAALLGVGVCLAALVVLLVPAPRLPAATPEPAHPVRA